MAELVTVELVYGCAQRQHLLRLSLPAHASVREAALRSGLNTLYPELDLATVALGVFGKQITKPEQRLIQEGDRIELYRPLLADPKEVRRLRAAKAAQAKIANGN